MESKNYIVKSIGEIAEGTIKLELAPEDGKPIQYSPGQFMVLTAPSGTKRAYSIASSPSMEYLEFAIKQVNGEFTSQLKTLKEGGRMQVDGPLGPFIYNTCGGYVLIAGGVGITPMVSILRDRDGRSECQEVTLFYSSRTKNRLAYYDELREIDSRNSNLKTVFTLTRENPPGWEYETGHIDAELLKKYLTDLEKKRYFVCGPARMVDSFREILKGLGIPEENCTFEGWNV
jgi:ferredoxin-NADP reductase